ncbi:MAG: hypothetical protein ACE5HE_12820 [Phycisphaerae bacterium]
MFGKMYPLAVALSALVAGTGCNQKLTSTDLQMAHMAETRNKPHAHLTYMADNALASDMSLADFHFVGHTSELSGTGVARLDRLAYFLDVYGGTVRYETFLTDDELVAQRIAHVREYLDLAGCDMDRVEVTAMLSGGRGMPAAKAIAIEEQGVRPQAGEEGGAAEGLLSGSSGS